MEAQSSVEGATSEVNGKAQKFGDELTNGMLRDQITELEEQKTRLLLSLKEYRQKYEQQKNDQADIYYYLNKKLDENYETIAALEEQILTEQADRESHERSLEKRIHTLELELITNEAKFSAKLNDAEEKLNKLKEFGDNKEELDRNLEKLLETLENERTQFRSLADEMERRSVQERDRIRKECSRQFEDYKRDVHEEADNKLSTKTKKTLAINSMIKTELKHQSKQADQVLVYNQRVLDRDRELRQELELSQATQSEMVNRLALYQRLIKQLNERISVEEKQSADKIHILNGKIADKEAELESTTRRFQEFKEQIVAERENQDALWLYLSRKFKSIVTKKSRAHVGSSIADSIASDDSNDRMLCELVQNCLQKYPDRFAISSAAVSTSQPAGRAVHTDGHSILPRIANIESSLSVSDRDLGGSTLTGIYTWDSARTSSKNKWWTGLSLAENDVEGEIVQIGETGHPKESRNIGVQTEGQLLPYPPGSSWIQRGSMHQEQVGSTRPDNDAVPPDSNRDHTLESDIKQPNSGVKAVTDPLMTKRATKRHRRSNVRYVQQRVVPDERSTEHRENAFDGVVTGMGQSIKSRSQTDKKIRTNSTLLPQCRDTEYVGDTDDDALSSISLLTTSPRC